MQRAQFVGARSELPLLLMPRLSLSGTCVDDLLVILDYYKPWSKALDVALQGLVQNQSFYPYYGSSQKLVYQPNAIASNVYSSKFTPYTSINLTDTYPPAFQPGFPTATNINDTSFRLTCAFYESSTVYYVVMLASAVSQAALDCADIPKKSFSRAL